MSEQETRFELLHNVIVVNMCSRANQMSLPDRPAPTETYLAVLPPTRANIKRSRCIVQRNEYAKSSYQMGAVVVRCKPTTRINYYLVTDY